MAERDQVDILAKIEETLKSPKVDAYILHQFYYLRQENKDFNPEKSKVPFLARVANEEVRLDHVLSRIGVIYGMLAPFSAMPEIVENPDIIYIEASR